MKNSNDIIRNRNRDLPTYSAVPQPTASPRTLNTYYIIEQITTMQIVYSNVYQAYS